MRDPNTEVVATFLPGWVRAVWAVLTLLVLAVQVWQAARATGAARWWHGLYAGAALGMVVMFALHPMDSPDFAPAPTVVLVLAVLGAIAVAVALVRWRAAPTPWVLALVDLLALAYIQIPSVLRPILICVLVAAYLFVQVVLRVVAAVRVSQRSRVLVGSGGSSSGSDASAARVGAVVPVSLAVLALGMLYMISI